MKRIIYHTFILFFVTCIICLSSCINDSELSFKAQTTKTLSLYLKAPLSTRAEADNEDLLTNKNLRIYVFSTENGMPNKLAVVAKPENYTVTLDSSSGLTNRYKIDFKIPSSSKGELAGCILVNSKFNGNYTPTSGDSYEEFCKALEHKITVKLAPKDLTPLAGIFFFNPDDAKVGTDIKLVRAFARARFTLDHIKATSKKYDFKSIEEVKIFRAHDSYAILPKFSIDNYGDIKYELTTPLGGKYLLENSNNLQTTDDVTIADQFPLTYKYGNNAQSTRDNEIILCEEHLASDGARDQVLTAIIGVKLDTPDILDTRYYRVDFSKYDEQGKPIDFSSIIRNKVYSISLAGANTSGSGEPEEALTEESVLFVGFKEWDEYNIDGENLNGQYYFNLKSGDVSMGFQASSSIDLSYETDISDAEIENNAVIKWLTPEGQELPASRYFKLKPDFANKTLVVTPIKENGTKDDWTELLEVKIFNHLFKISVTQFHKPATYQFDTKYTKVNGVYVKGRNNDDYEENYVEVKLYSAERASIENLSFRITSPKVDGIYIDEKGEFGTVQSEQIGGATVYSKIVKLKVRGTSTEAKDKTFVLESDGVVPSYLKITIPFAYTPKKILGIYQSNDPERLSNNPGFKKLIEFSNNQNPNFGLITVSSVKAEQITYKESNMVITENSLVAEQPDVLIIGRALTSSEATALYDYTSKRTLTNSRGGKTAIIVMNGDDSIFPLLIKNETFKTASASSIGLLNGPVKRGSMTFNTISGLSPQERGQYRYFLPFYDWDNISNGSFGKLGTLFPKLSKNGLAIMNLRYDKTIKYTGMLPYAIDIRDREKRDWAYSMFRLTDIPVLWIGDKAFVNNQQEWGYGTDGKIMQLVDNRYYKCSSEPYIDLGMAYNGFVFANILEWAFHTSEYGNK